MSETTERDRGLLSLIDRLVKRPGTSAAIKPSETTNPAAIDEDIRDGLAPIIPDEKPPASLEPQLTVESTREVSRTALEGLIVKALQAGEGYPPDGFEITVYGSRPWNAMLRVKPAAGAIDAEAWRNRLQTVVLLFRDRYDLKDDTDA